MRNEMETNLPREPANLEGLKDTHPFTGKYIHVYLSAVTYNRIGCINIEESEATETVVMLLDI